MNQRLSGFYDGDPFGLWIEQGTHPGQEGLDEDALRDLILRFADVFSDMPGKWIQLCKVFRWENAEPERGRFDWEYLDEVVRRYSLAGKKIVAVIDTRRNEVSIPEMQAALKAADNDISVMASLFNKAHAEVVGGYHRNSGLLPPDDEIPAYKRFVFELVNRYKDSIQHWCVIDEIGTGAFPGRTGYFVDATAEYAELLRITSAEIRRANPEAVIYSGGPEIWHVEHDAVTRKITRGGVTEHPHTENFVADVLREIKNEPPGLFDVFFLHHIGRPGPLWPPTEYRKTVPWLQRYREELAQAGRPNLPVVLQLTAPGAGYGGTLAEKSERDVAGELVKRYALSLGAGITRMFFVGITRLSERTSLAYYTYIQMVQKLSGSDFGKVRVISTGDPNVFAYEFTKTKGSVVVAWWDYFADVEYRPGSHKRLSLPRRGAKNAVVTDAVPSAASAKEIISGKAGFPSSSADLEGDFFVVRLKETPVYVEVT